MGTLTDKAVIKLHEEVKELRKCLERSEESADLLKEAAHLLINEGIKLEKKVEAVMHALKYKTKDQHGGEWIETFLVEEALGIDPVMACIDCTWTGKLSECRRMPSSMLACDTDAYQCPECEGMAEEIIE